MLYRVFVLILFIAISGCTATNPEEVLREAGVSDLMRGNVPSSSISCETCTTENHCRRVCTLDCTIRGMLFETDVPAYEDSQQRVCSCMCRVPVTEDETAFHQAIYTEETSWCDKILDASGSISRENCLITLAMLRADSKFCDAIQLDEDSKNDCLTMVAIANRDLSLCEQISSSESKDSCQQAVKDPTVFPYIAIPE